MSDSPFKLSKKGHVAWLALANPAKRNSMGQAFFQGLRQHMADLAADAEVRAVVLHAEGKVFTAGLDLMEAAGTLQGNGVDDRVRLQAHIRDIQDCMTAVERCPKPVIAAVDGPCIGGGVDLVCACDIRICTRTARFAVRETKMAIVADLGTLQRLPHIIGQGWARHLVLTGRDFDAEEALRLGFVTSVCSDADELMAEAAALANEIAGMSPLAVQGSKDVLNFSRDRDVATGLEYVAQKNAAVLVSNDLMEAVQAFMQKREPEFKGK